MTETKYPKFAEGQNLLGHHYGSLVLLPVEGTNPIDPKKIDRNALLDRAVEHLQEFIKCRLAAASTYSIKINVLYSDVANALKKLESSGLIFLKEIPKGKFRAYKEFSCYGSVKQWKQCPEWKCQIDDLVHHCPYFPEVKNPVYEKPDFIAYADEATSQILEDGSGDEEQQ